MRIRLLILLTVPLIIGLVPQVKPIAILGGVIAILAPQSIIEILKLVYGARLMPEAIVIPRGSQAIVRIGGRDEVIKAWVIKEFVRIIEKRRW